MAGFLYPRALLESWFKLCNKSPKLEAIGVDSDDSDEFSEESLDNDDSYEQMGRYGNISDVGDDDVIENDVDTATGISKSAMHTIDTNELAGKKKSTPGNDSSMTPTALSKKLAREQLNATQNQNTVEARRVKEQVIAAYEASPACMSSDTVVQCLEDLKNETPYDSQSVTAAQDIWAGMEKLGIAAHEAGCVPSGIPENPMTLSILSSLAYASISPEQLMYILSDPDDRAATLLDKNSMTRLVRMANSHIMGETGGTPALVNNLYSGNTIKKDTSSKPVKTRKDAATGIEYASQDSLKQADMKMEDTYPHVKQGVYAAPYDLVRITIDSIKGFNKPNSRWKSSMDTLLTNGITEDKLAADLLFMGYSNFKEKYNIVPTLSKVYDKYITTSCYLTVPKTEDEPVTMTGNCAKVLYTELKSIYDASTTKLLKDGVAQDKGILRTVCDELDTAIKSTKSKTAIRKINSPSLVELLHGTYTSQRGMTKTFKDGEFHLVKPDPEPLFKYIVSNVAPVMRASSLARGRGQAGEDELDSVDTHQHGLDAQMSAGHDLMQEDTDTGNMRIDSISAYADTYLKPDREEKKFYRMLGLLDDMPSPDATSAEKGKFFASVLEGISKSFEEVGCTSSVQADGNNIKINISPDDSETISNHIIDVWKHYASQYDIDANASTNAVCYGLKRAFLWKMVENFLRWFGTIDGGVDQLDSLKRKLREGDYDRSELYQLLPSINVAALVKENIINGAVNDGISSDVGEYSKDEVFAFVKKFLMNTAKKNNADVTTAPIIHTIFTNLMDTYGSRDAIIAEASTTEPNPGNEAVFYEWCVIRFMASAINDMQSDTSNKSFLIPPEEVGLHVENDGEVDNSEPNDNDELSGETEKQKTIGKMKAQLKEYQDAIDTKPAKYKFIKDSRFLDMEFGEGAWEDYEYLKKAVNEKDAFVADESDNDYRVMDMEPNTVSNWIREVYIKRGEPREVLLLLLSLIYIFLSIDDDSVNSDKYESADYGLFCTFEKWRPITEVWSEYGMDLVNAIVGYDTGDGGAAIDDLMRIIDSNSSVDPDLIDRLDSICFTLSKTGFLQFNFLA